MDVIALDGEQFEWSINGRIVRNGENGVSITQDGNKSKLTIAKAKPEHSGKILRNVRKHDETLRKSVCSGHE